MKELIIFLKKNNIDFTLDENILNENSEDTSLFKILPKIVIYPKNKFEISELVKFVNINKNYSIVSRSGGTDMSGAAIGESIILSFGKYFNHIISIDKYKKEAVVEPGVYYRDFEKETLKNRVILPTFPASREMCMIGGMVANNAGGEKSLKYGKTNKYIKEIECVLSNGEIVNFKPLTQKELEDKLNTLSKNTLEYKIYKELSQIALDENSLKTIRQNIPKVSKNSAGYYLWDLIKKEREEIIFDPTQIIVGSQGTLAIATKIKVKLVEVEKYTRLALIFLKNLKDLGTVQKIIMKYKPESFESYDKHTFKIALKFLPALIKNIAHKSHTKRSVNYFKLAFSFWREFKMLLFFGMPELFLLAEFTGNDLKEINKQVSNCEKDLKSQKIKLKTQIVKNKLEKDKYWTMRRESFNLLRNRVKGMHTAPFIDDIVVEREKLGEFLEKLIPILDKYKLFYTVAGHVGDGNLHIIPLMSFKNKAEVEENAKIMKACANEVYDLVSRYKGSTTAEHNDGLVRTPFLYKIFDEKMMNLFQQVKKTFDPKNILNPDKKVDLIKDPEKAFDDNLKLMKY